MTTMKRTTSRRPKREGIAVIEILVSMVILAVGLLGAAGMTVSASRRGSWLSTQSGRDGIILQELNKLASMPYDSLTARVGCTTTSRPPLAYTRCIAVTDVTDGAGYKRVRLIVSPSASWARPDTVYVNRVRGAISINPFTP
jgi:hypothetical protein